MHKILLYTCDYDNVPVDFEKFFAIFTLLMRIKAHSVNGADSQCMNSIHLTGKT